MSGIGKNAIDMTGGSLWKNILVFSLPLMMTQMLEVLFNLSDVAIAGKYADYIALGAVGSTALLVSLLCVIGCHEFMAAAAPLKLSQEGILQNLVALERRALPQAEVQQLSLFDQVG